MRLAAVLPLVLLAGCGSRPAAPVGVAVNPALASLVPADATFLAGADLTRIRNSPLFAKYLPELLKRGEARSGGDLLDYHEQLEEVIAASTGGRYLVVARGRFDREAIEKRLREEKLEAWSYHGKAGFRRDGMGFVFLTNDLAMAGPEAELQASARRFGQEAAMPARFVKSLQSMPSDVAFWAVTIGMPSLPDVPPRSNLANLPKLLQGVELGTLHGRLEDGFRLGANASCASQDDAREIETALKGMIGIARLSAPNGKPELLRAFDGIKVEQSGTDVRLEANLPAETIEALRGMAGR